MWKKAFSFDPNKARMTYILLQRFDLNTSKCLLTSQYNPITNSPAKRKLTQHFDNTAALLGH